MRCARRAARGQEGEGGARQGSGRAGRTPGGAAVHMALVPSGRGSPKAAQLTGRGAARWLEREGGAQSELQWAEKGQDRGPRGGCWLKEIKWAGFAAWATGGPGAAGQRTHACQEDRDRVQCRQQCQAALQHRGDAWQRHDGGKAGKVGLQQRHEGCRHAGGTHRTAAKKAKRGALPTDEELRIVDAHARHACHRYASVRQVQKRLALCRGRRGEEVCRQQVAAETIGSPCAIQCRCSAPARC